MPQEQPAAVAWASSSGLTSYDDALSVMEERAAAIAAGAAAEMVWLLEHSPMYTAGTSAKPEHLLQPVRLPIHHTGRGGQVTYHGPGQRVAYLMLDVRARFAGDVRRFVRALEDWLIEALASLSVAGRTVPERVGIWIGEPGSEAKIAALGIRIRRGVSLHGISINVAPDLAHYAGIVPCGIADRGVTSLVELRAAASMKDVDNALIRAFERRFAPVFDAPDPLNALRMTAASHQD